MFEAHARAGARARARGARRRPAHRPPRRARRPARLPASGCATRGVEHVWVEKILEPGEQLRDWPVEGTVGYEFLNDVTRAVRRPGRRGAADRAVRGADRRRRAVPRGRAEAKLEQARDDVRARGRAAARALADAARSSSEALAVAAGLPHLRRAADRAGRARPTARRSPRPLPDDAARVRSCSRTRAPRRVRDALPADDAAGDGQGRRGHGLLPLRCGCSRSTRSAATPAASRCRVDEFHAANLERARALPAQPARHADARHEALRRRARAASARWPGWPTSGRERARLRSAAAATTRPNEELPAPPDARRRLADRARAARGVPGEGAARGQAQHELGRAGRGARAARVSAVRRRCLRAAVPADFEPFAARVAAAGERVALGQTLLKLTVPGRAGHLPGRRARAASRSSTPTTAGPVDWDGAARGADGCARRRRAQAAR